ncbi:hypothetical protein DM828_15230 [Pseudomonas umsongensis]|nr:hypothetical protein [Pseudomonas umsongensis]
MVGFLLTAGKGVWTVLAPSRASPLPHSTELLQKECGQCGSGLAREGASTNNANLGQSYVR